MNRQEILSAMVRELKSRGIVSTQKELAALIGGSEVTISGALKGREDYLTDSLLRRINTAVGNIFNKVWLITGEGEMLADTKADVQQFSVNMGNGTQATGGSVITTGADAIELETIRRENEGLREENSDLKEEIKGLQKKVAEKDKAIARLEGKIEIYKEMVSK